MHKSLFLFVLAMAITFVLQAKDYPKTRPNKSGEPTKVEVSLYIIDIEGIDNKEQSFKLDVVVRLRWKDIRLSGISTPVPLQSIWNPNIQLYNLRDMDERFPNIVHIQKDGSVQYTQRYQATLSSPLDFKKFPFDAQILPITLLSFGNTPQEVEMIFNIAGGAEKFSISDWNIKSIGAAVSSIKANLFNDSSETIVRPRLDYQFSAKRHIQYYWWKVLAPLMLILFLSWAVFWIDPSQVGAQIGVSGTSILTLIAFLYKLDNILPPVSYLTHMDHFIFTALILVFIAYLEALISTTFALNGKKQIALNMDMTFRIGYPIIFLVIIFIFWIK